MKRDPALVPLTHDHHHALAQARRLRLAAGLPSDQRTEAARGFLAFFRSELVPHFREEEELLFPLVVEAGGWPPEDLVQVLVEHVEIHALVGRVQAGVDAGAVPEPVLLELTGLLENHIRLEERDLFPLIERVVPPPVLHGVSLAPRHRASPADAGSAGEDDPQEEGAEGA